MKDRVLRKVVERMGKDIYAQEKRLDTHNNRLEDLESKLDMIFAFWGVEVVIPDPRPRLEMKTQKSKSK